jgi:hypothetical protein
MKRVCPIASAAIVMALSSSAHPAEAARLLVPLPSTAELCAEDKSACLKASLAAGADVGEFVEKHSVNGKAYTLTLQLPAGEFALQDSWTITGATVPPQIRHLSILGAAPFTRLSGARDARSLGAKIRTGPGGIAVVALPSSWRKELLPHAAYTSEEPDWPTLHDASGALRLTRWPRDGWAEFEQSDAMPGNTIRAGMSAPLDEWRDERSAWLLGFLRFGWHASYAPLTRIAAETRNLTASGAIRYGVGSTGRYRVLNLKSQLREPGDYWIDARKGEIQFRPHAGLAPASVRIAVLATPMLVLSDVRSVSVNGIEFVATRGNGVTIANSVDVDLSKLAFDRIGRTGVLVDGGHSVHVRDSSFTDIGDDAVTLRGGDRTTLTGSGHSVENCRIARPSQRLFTPATAIRLEGVGHIVRGNVIEDAPHSAVYFAGNNHLIEANWIERVCLEVDDAGAIYAGRDWTYRGNLIRRNVISTMPRRNGTANLNAIYLDDMLSGTQVDSNLLFDVPRGILIGGGRDNVVQRNLFVRTPTPILIDQRALEWASASVQPEGVMAEGLRRVPYRGANWRHAYPMLAEILTQRPAAPLNNIVGDNSALNSGAAIIAGSAAAGGRIAEPRRIEAATYHASSVREFVQACTVDPPCAAMISDMRISVGLSLQNRGSAAR